MFIKGKLDRKQRLKKRMQFIKGKKVKDKIKTLMPDILQELYKIKEFDKYYNKKLASQMQLLLTDYEDNVQTSSKDSVLFYLIECYDDLKDLNNDMLHQMNQNTYDKRLTNIIDFLRDFGVKSYYPYKEFYDDEQSTLVDQINSIVKDIRYKVGKLDNKINTEKEQIMLLEKQNIEAARKLETLSKSSFDYKETMAKMTDNQKQMDYQKGVVNLVRKSKNSFALLANMFSQLAVFEEYHQYLKGEGYIRRLIRKLYHNSKNLDLMDNVADLAEVLSHMKDEISEIESIASPAQKMVFKDLDDNIDEEIISQYKDMI